jgi:hypothetical protein
MNEDDGHAIPSIISDSDLLPKSGDTVKLRTSKDLRLWGLASRNSFLQKSTDPEKWVPASMTTNIPYGYRLRLPKSKVVALLPLDE